MLEQLIKTLCEELSISPAPQKGKEKEFVLKINDQISTKLTDLEPGVALFSSICKLPEKNREDLFIYLMRANLLGQGTGGCRIGLDSKSKELTLTLGLPYELNYPLFRERLEDFVNYTLFWREEIKKCEQQGLYPK